MYRLDTMRGKKAKELRKAVRVGDNNEKTIKPVSQIKATFFSNGAVQVSGFSLNQRAAQ